MNSRNASKKVKKDNLEAMEIRSRISLRIIKKLDNMVLATPAWQYCLIDGKSGEVLLESDDLMKVKRAALSRFFRRKESELNGINEDPIGL